MGECHKCEKAFRDSYGLRKHMKTHLKDTVQKDSFFSMPTLSSGKEAFSCPICDKSYNSKYNVSRHMKSHREHGNFGHIEQMDIIQGGKADFMENDDELEIIEERLVIDTENKTEGADLHGFSEDVEYFNEAPPSLSKTCSQCGKHLRDKWALKRHMNSHTFSVDTTSTFNPNQDEPNGEDLSTSNQTSPPVMGNVMSEYTNMFDAESIDKDIEMIQNEAKDMDVMEVNEEETNVIGPQTSCLGDGEDPSFKQPPNWQLPSTNTCNVFVQPLKADDRIVPTIPNLKPPLAVFQAKSIQPVPTMHSVVVGQPPTIQILPFQSFPSYSIQYLPVQPQIAQKLTILASKTGENTEALRSTETGTNTYTDTMQTLAPESNKSELNTQQAMDREKFCHICNKTFQSNYNKTRHMKTHSTAMPIECPKCGTHFKTKDNLSKHLKRSGCAKIAAEKQALQRNVSPTPAPHASHVPVDLVQVVSEKFATINSILHQLQLLAK